MIKHVNLKTYSMFIMLSFFCWVNLYAQEQKVTLNIKDASLKEAFGAIEKQTSYRFSYRNLILDNRKDITLSENDVLVSSALTKILKNRDLTYKIVSPKMIVISEKANQESPSGKSQKISGTVLDDKGEPVIGANVSVKGATQGTITDLDGKFLLEAASGSTLLVSFIGYTSKQVKVSSQDVYKITLVEDSKALDEVVVIGYGSVKKQNLTSSVSKMNENAVKDRAITNVGEAFQGQLAGVQAQMSGGGMPGQELTLHIRGINTVNGDSNPLYVIDGVPRDNMSDLNPSDIASIQVLKDASASAIYGARGSNGVVVIETKQGAGNATVTFEGYYGLQNAEKKLDMMSGEEWMAYNMFRRNLSYLERKGSMNDPMDMRPVQDQIPESWTNIKSYTDWQDAISRTAPIQSYQLSASAKGSIGRIYFSAGYFNQDGIIINSNFERLNARLNAAINIGKKLQVGTSISISNSSRDGADVDAGPNGGGGKEGPLHIALMQSPLMQLTEGTVEWGYPVNLTDYPNPVEQLKGTTDNTKNFRASTSFWGEYKIINDLTFKSQLSYNYDGKTYEYFRPANVANKNTNTTGRSEANNTIEWSIQNTFTYDKNFKGHHLNVLAGQSAQKRDYYIIQAEATGWPFESLGTLNLATTPTRAQTRKTGYAIASFFGRVNYEYLDRYLLNFSARYDGSSRFGTNSKWGFFPSVSAGWKINEESFMENVKTISLLKLRASWGKSGNDRIGDYAYQALLNLTNTSWGNSVVPGITPSNIPNNDLKWESTTAVDFGLDLSLFKNRIQMNFDYYINTTNDLLFSLPIPRTTGFNNMRTNVGKVRNKGWEFDITSRNIVGKFNWSTSLNLSANTNKVLDMGGVKNFITTVWDGQFITEVGSSLSQFYGYKTDGLLQPSDFDEKGNALVPILNGQRVGNPKYVDLKKDGKIDSNDYTKLGNNLPDLIYGITNTFSWNNFDLSVLVQGQIGGKVMFLGQRQYDNGGGGTNQFNRWLRCYKDDYDTRYGVGENPWPMDYIKANNIDISWDGETPNPLGKSENNDDRRIYSTTYLRIKNIKLAYNFPKIILKKSAVKAATLYISIDNVAKFDNYKGASPESNTLGKGASAMGIDYCTYPVSRRYVIGANVTF